MTTAFLRSRVLNTASLFVKNFPGFVRWFSTGTIWQIICGRGAYLEANEMKTTTNTLKKPMSGPLLAEFRKLGYGLVLIGVIALLHAWGNIIQNEASWWELLFLFIGLIATLGGINLVIRFTRHGKSGLTSTQTPEIRK